MVYSTTKHLPIISIPPSVTKSHVFEHLAIEILEQAHNLNKPTRALNCLDTQNSGRSINSHNMNKMQSALQQLDIEHPKIVDNNPINYLHLYPDIIAPVACLNNFILNHFR